MATFCLVQPIADKFKAAIQDGTIDPEKMSSMSSEERHKMLADIVGKDNATQVNALFESKLLLKNQQAGMVAWAKRMLDMSPVRRQDLISKIERLDHVLSESEAKSFLGDLAETRLGVDVTQEEANKIADLTKNMVSLKEKDPTSIEYGRAGIKLRNYVSELKNEAGKFRMSDLKTQPLNAAKKGILGLGGLSKSLKATLDNSAIFNQGMKPLLTDPAIWAKNAMKSFDDIVRSFGGKEVLDEVDAGILSDKNYQKMVDAHLAGMVTEENFPTSLPERVPLFGRVYKASEAAYSAFLKRTRQDIFNKYINDAELAGINTNDPEQLRAIGRVVNSLTGRGHLGGAEQAANAVNNILFSPRNIKAQFDVLTAHSFDSSITPFARKKAAQNLLKIVAGMSSMLAVANAVRPGSAKVDPRSSSFGKIKIGNRTIDITGHAGALVTLASRLIPTKHNGEWGLWSESQSGNFTKLNSSQFGKQSGVDVLNSFFENRASPAFGAFLDYLKGQDFNGNKVTLPNEIKNAFLPLPISTAQEIWQDPSASNVNKILSIIADGLGLATNTTLPKQPSIDALMKAAAQAKLTPAQKKKNADAAAKAKATREKKKADFIKSLGQ